MRNRVRACITASLVALGLVFATVPAFAEGDEDTNLVSFVVEQNAEAFQNVIDYGSSLYDVEYAVIEGDIADSYVNDIAAQSTYDLRSEGVVTSVKNQSPWNSCWAFSAVAASETSILSEAKASGVDLSALYTNGELDLSERHLAYFAANTAGTTATQEGEGIFALDSSDDGLLDTGTLVYTSASVLSDGIGSVLESEVPYRNDEGILEDVYGDVTNNASQAIQYSSEGTWAADESERFSQVFALEESNVLPTTTVYDEEGNFIYVEAGTVAIKNELAQGRAVAVALYFDQDGLSSDGTITYMSTDTWAQCVTGTEVINHAVTIVGWDNSYSKDNFPEGSQPEGDGAWIAKNSYGSADGTFPNEYDWGDEGYFYISYYDRSLALAESFDYDIDSYNADGESDTIVAQYDYMPTSVPQSITWDAEVAMANVFTAEVDEVVWALACETASLETTVTYEVYALDEGFTNPTDGTLLATLEETYDYAGFHRATLSQGLSLNAGQQYAVVTTLETPYGYDVLIDSALNEEGATWLVNEAGADLSTYEVGVVNAGESYVMQAGAWSDLADVVAQLKEGDAASNEAGIAAYDYDNFSIKTYAEPLDTWSEDALTVEEAQYQQIPWVAVILGGVVLIVAVFALVRHRRKQKAAS